MSGFSAKIRDKKDWPKSVLSGGKENQLLREEIFVRTFHRWGGLVFIMDDQDNFPTYMMIRILPPLGEGFSFLIVNKLKGIIDGQLLGNILLP